jgi:hypothetical protein
MAEEGDHSYGPRALGPNAPIDDDGFTLTDAMRGWAIRTFGNALDIDYETAQFVDHFRAQAVHRPNWAAEWQKWIRRSAKFASERQRTNNVLQLPSGQTLTGTDARVAGWLALASGEENQ